MRLRLLSMCVTAAFLAATHGVWAQGVPEMVPYGGTIFSDGVPFNGDGQFKFAIISDPAAPPVETFWTNDGTSLGLSGGAPPTSATPVPVTDGVFSVNLGDTGMVAIPPDVFAAGETFLRVWFDDGVNAVQLLAPDRRLVSVPYAHRAAMADRATTADQATEADHATVADSVTSGGIALAPNSVDTVHLADGAVTSAKIADGAVTAAKVGASEITRDKLAPGARYTDAEAKDAVETGNLGVSGTLTTGGPVTAGGTVTAPAFVGDGSGLTGIGNIGGVVNAGSTTIGADSDGNGTGDIALQIDSVDAIRVANTRNVGIGTATPTAELDVVGTVKATTFAGSGAGLSGVIPAAGSVDTDQLAGSSVTGDKIDDSTVQRRVTDTCPAGQSIRAIGADGTVTCEVDDGGLTTVTTGDLADGAVTSAKILDGQVGNADLAVNAVTSSRILDGQVNNADLADNAVTSNKIADNTITSLDILDGTIVNGDLANSAVTSITIANNTITSADILDGTIVNGDLSNNAVTSAKIADNTIASADILDGTIANADLANSAVTSAKILDGTIASVDLAVGAVTSVGIADGTVSGADLGLALAEFQVDIQPTDPGPTPLKEIALGAHNFCALTVVQFTAGDGGTNRWCQVFTGPGGLGDWRLQARTGDAQGAVCRATCF